MPVEPDARTCTFPRCKARRMEGTGRGRRNNVHGPYADPSRLHRATATTVRHAETRSVLIDGLGGYHLAGVAVSIDDDRPQDTPEIAVQDMLERVRSATEAAGRTWPDGRIMVSLHPRAATAHARQLDLAAAVAVAMADGALPATAAVGLDFAAGLSPGGLLVPVTRVREIAAHALDRNIMVASADAREAALSGACVADAETFAEALAYLQVRASSRENFNGYAELTQGEKAALARWRQPRDDTAGLSAAGFPVRAGDHVMPAGIPYRDAAAQGGYVESFGTFGDVPCVVFRPAAGPGACVITAVADVIHSGFPPLYPDQPGARPRGDAIPSPYHIAAEAAEPELMAAAGHLRAGRRNQAAAALEQALLQPLGQFAAAHIGAAHARLTGRPFPAPPGRPGEPWPPAGYQSRAGLRAWMLAFAGRDARRAAEDDDEQKLTGGYFPEKHALSRMRWDAVNAARVDGLPAEQAAEMFRHDIEKQAHAARFLSLREAELEEHAKGMETLRRWRRGLPARDDSERDSYREYNELEADRVDDYVQNVLIPDRLWEVYDGPLTTYDEFRADYLASRSGEDLAASAVPAVPAEGGSGQQAVRKSFPAEFSPKPPPQISPGGQRARQVRARTEAAKRQASGPPPF